MKAPWPFGHLGIKAASVGIAVLLWLFVSGEETVERALSVPLEFQEVPAGLEMTGNPPSVVDVRVRGESARLSRLGPGDILAQLNLEGVRVGRRLYPMTPDQFRVPFGVEVVQVNPPTVTLSFEPSATKQVRVVPAIEGDPAAGYMVGKITTDPALVEIVGPQSAVNSATEAITESVSVAGARGPVIDSVVIGLANPELRLKGPKLAQVGVDINPGPDERTVRDRPVHLQNLASNLVARATPNQVDVVLRGSREALNRLDGDDVTALVDLSGLGAGDYTLPVRIDAAPRAGVARILPATIQVTISSGKD